VITLVPGIKDGKREREGGGTMRGKEKGWRENR